MVAPVMYTPAILYLVRAWSLYRDLPYIPDSNVLLANSKAQLKLKRVLSILGRAHIQLGEVRKASLRFALGSQLRVHFLSTLRLPLRLIPHQLNFAQSLHLQGNHHDAVEIIRDVIASLDGYPTVDSAVAWMNYSSDSDDEDEVDADGEGHAPSLYCHYRSLPNVYLCPWLLLGQCYVALGTYSSAVEYLTRSRREVSLRDSFALTANVEFSYVSRYLPVNIVSLKIVDARCIHFAICCLSGLLSRTQLLNFVSFVSLLVPVLRWYVRLGLSCCVCHSMLTRALLTCAKFIPTLIAVLGSFCLGGMWSICNIVTVVVILLRWLLMSHVSRSGPLVSPRLQNIFFATSLALRPCTLCLRPYSRVMCATIFI